jgi:hypothetical protein
MCYFLFIQVDMRVIDCKLFLNKNLYIIRYEMLKEIQQNNLSILLLLITIF